MWNEREVDILLALAVSVFGVSLGSCYIKANIPPFYHTVMKVTLGEHKFGNEL